MLILGIETSCDETAAAVIEDGVRIISSVVASQIDIHARYGGIVPEVASRQHILSIIPVIDRAMTEAGIEWQDLGAIAVTRGPGLAGSLLIGLNAAKSLSLARKIPLVGVNHLEGHIYANWLSGEADSRQPAFPLICLIVSGGHSDLVLMKDHGDYTLLGRTRDDAAGEAFDKAARVLELGYPGGPAIQRAAESGAPLVKMPRAWLRGTSDFSFSGLKTALLRSWQNGEIDNRQDAAASFQEAVVDVLVTKAVRAARDYGVNQLVLAGGVAANGRLRQRLQSASPVPVSIPELRLCTDNAAMIGACGYFRFIRGVSDGPELDISPGLKLA